MKQQNTFWVKIDKTSEHFSYKYHLPDISVFETVDYEKSGIKVIGYYLGLDEKYFTFDTIKDKILNAEYHTFSQISAYFLLIIVNSRTNTVSVLTDNYLSIPCYWKINKNEIHFASIIDTLIDQSDIHSIDIFSVFQLILSGRTFQDKTIFNSIQRLPPSTLLSVDSNEKYHIESYLINNLKGDNFSVSPEKFSNQVIQTLSIIIEDYLKRISNFSFSCDLSSGLDCTLVSYLLKQYSANNFICVTGDKPPPFNQENKEIIDNFTVKHNLNIIHYEMMLPSFSEYLSLYKTIYPNDMKAEIYSQHLAVNKKNNIKVIFSGHGGDEIYGVKSIYERYRYAPYLSYYDIVSYIQRKENNILTEKSKQILLQKDHYKTAFYPTWHQNSVTEVNSAIYPYISQYNLTQLMPLQDIRLSALFQKSPLFNGVTMTKNRFWEHFTSDIFVRGQLSSKSIPPKSYLHNYIEYNNDLIDHIIRNNIFYTNGLLTIENIQTELINPLLLMRFIRIDQYLKFIEKKL